MARFNHQDAKTFRYMWPGFLLKLPSSTSNNFAQLGEHIFVTLKSASIFETDGDGFVQPSGAIYVPATFRDDSGHFLLDDNSWPMTSVADAGSEDDSQKKRYISHRYEDYNAELAVIKELGIEILTLPDFLEFLRKRIAEDFNGYKERPLGWHAKLSNVLLEVASVHQIQSLPLIQLQCRPGTPPRERT